MDHSRHGTIRLSQGANDCLRNAGPPGLPLRPSPLLGALSGHSARGHDHELAPDRGPKTGRGRAGLSTPPGPTTRGSASSAGFAPHGRAATARRTCARRVNGAAPSRRRDRSGLPSRPGRACGRAGRDPAVLDRCGPARPDHAMPRSPDGPCGVFALRSPARPNPVAVAVVRLAGGRYHGRAVLRLDALDAFDGTALLDIKPWLPSVDVPPG